MDNEYGESMIVAGNSEQLFCDFLDDIINKYKVKDENIHRLATQENSIKIQFIKDIKKTLKLKPAGCEKAILVIYESQKMTDQAANALLKILEEPPRYAIIILFTDNISNLLPTIISRCKKYYLSDNSRCVDKNYLDIYKKILKAEMIYEKINISKDIVVNPQFKIDRFIIDFIAYLKSIETINYVKIQTCANYLRLYKNGINKKLFIENLIINI